MISVSWYELSTTVRILKRSKRYSRKYVTNVNLQIRLLFWYLKIKDDEIVSLVSNKQICCIGQQIRDGHFKTYEASISFVLGSYVGTVMRNEETQANEVYMSWTDTSVVYQLIFRHWGMESRQLKGWNHHVCQRL